MPRPPLGLVISSQGFTPLPHGTEEDPTCIAPLDEGGRQYFIPPWQGGIAGGCFSVGNETGVSIKEPTLLFQKEIVYTLYANGLGVHIQVLAEM
jgi:hypothetical protein